MKPKQTKSINLKVKVTPIQYDGLSQMAAICSLNLSEYLRKLFDHDLHLLRIYNEMTSSMENATPEQLTIALNKILRLAKAQAALSE